MPPIINRDKCYGCGECVEVCAQDVFFGSQQGETPVVAYPEMCCYCNSCVEECSVEGAIKLRIPLPLHIAYK